MQVKFVDLAQQYLGMRDEILQSVDRVCQTGHYILGPEVEKFEEEFARYCGTKYAVALGNGSDALYLALLALKIGPGDEVITAPNSFVASAWTIANTGAKIVFSDVAEDDMNLDPELLEAAITPRTKAIMPVHLTGRVARMKEIMAIAEKHGLAVIEDAAQAVGASRDGRRAGAFGVCAGFSLHPLKNLHVYGDGGVLTSDDAALVSHIKKHRNHGLVNRDECEFWGVNSRLDEVQAAILRLKLPHLDGWNRRFQQIAARYQAELGDHLRVPSTSVGEEQVYHRFMVRHPERDRLAKHLLEQGVETRVNYPIPLHLQPAAHSLGYRAGDFPVTERLANTILSLPIYAELGEEQVEHVIASVKAFF